MEDARDSVLSVVREQGIRYVRFTWTDNAGLIRAKAVYAAHLGDFLEGSRVGITVAAQALPVMYDALAPGSGLTPAGEVHLDPDWSTFAALPHTPGQARVLVDLWENGRPWAQCPRTFLKRLLGRASGAGLRVAAAFENEFYLLRPDGATWAPADGSVFCQTNSYDNLAPVLNEIAAALEGQGVVPEMLYPESGPGQFEMPVRYADALAAADHQVVFRETVRAVARQHGLIASFVPKIFADRAGNGAHLHLSLWRDGQNLTADPARPDQLAAETASFVAGVLLHLPALMALTTPTPNSFKRIRPRFWSGAFACWGYGNREGAVRVPPPARVGQPLSNVELKTVDPSCNPYLALGATLAAGLDGLANRLSLAPAVQCDPADLSEAQRAEGRIVPLPTSPDVALRNLANDGVLGEALGPDLLRSFVAVRRAEWEGLKDLEHEDEVRLLLERY
jgi:glutamine synthetase